MIARAKPRNGLVRPRWRLFGAIPEWRPRLPRPVLQDLPGIEVSPPTLVHAEPLIVGGPHQIAHGKFEVGAARSHRLRRFDLDLGEVPPPRAVTKDCISVTPPTSTAEDRKDPAVRDDLDERLSAILQPPLEGLVAPGGVLEWPNALLPYQIEGVRTLLERHELLLADDMGLGKTIQVIAALRILFHRQEIHRALIVAPSSLARQWKREASKWAPELRSSVVSAAADQRAALWRLPAHLKIVGYETLREDVSFRDTTPVTEQPWDVVVLDEASKIKNREASVSKAVKALPRDRRWALTGTPLETSIEDVRSILEFLVADPGKPAHVPFDAQELKGLLRTVQLRRTKEEVLTDLPAKTIETVELELQPAQRAAYDEAETAGIVQLKERGPKVSVSHVLEFIVRLKQICNRDPASGDSAKLDDIEQRLEVLASEGHRALLFTQFTDEVFGVTMIQSRLAKFSPIPFTGSMSPAEKSRAEEKFKHDDSSKLMVLSVRAGGFGLNLQSASYVFHLDRWWNPAVEDQAEGRAHRMGQQFPVTVFRYVCVNTIEERIERVLSERRALFADVIEDVSLDLASALTKEELFGLFGLHPPEKPGRREGVFQGMAGEEFEQWLGELLEAQGFRVQRTKRSRDGGIDLLATKTDLIGILNKLYVQCKNHSEPVGVQVIRELRGVVPDREAGTTPVVACPAGFTRDAIEFAGSNGVLLWSAEELEHIAHLGVNEN